MLKKLVFTSSIILCSYFSASSAIIIHVKSVKNVHWIWLTRTCAAPGNWMCIDVTITRTSEQSAPTSMPHQIELDYPSKTALVKLSLVDDDNFLMQYLSPNGDFNFAGDFYLKASIVEQACGVNKDIILKQGTYSSYRNGDFVTMQVPFDELP